MTPVRSQAAYLQAIAALDVEHAQKYQPGFGGVHWTHCNLFVSDACRALFVPMTRIAGSTASWARPQAGSNSST